MSDQQLLIESVSSGPVGRWEVDVGVDDPMEVV